MVYVVCTVLVIGFEKFKLTHVVGTKSCVFCAGGVCVLVGRLEGVSFYKRKSLHAVFSFYYCTPTFLQIMILDCK